MTRRSGAFKCEDIDSLETEANLMAKGISRDESWNFEYDPENKHQSCQWSPGLWRSQEARSDPNQTHTDRVFRYQRRNRHRIFTPRPDNQSTSLKRFYSVWCDQCARRGGTYGEKIRSCFTKITRRLTHHWVSDRSQRRGIFRWSLSTRTGSWRFFCSPRSMKSSKEHSFRTWNPSKKRDDGAAEDSRRCFPAVHEYFADNLSVFDGENTLKVRGFNF